MRVAIVGGGISGLTAAHRLAADGHDPIVLDDGDAPGGLVASVRRDGFLCEHGPQAVLDGAEETRALIAAAGLAERAQTASAASRRRFVYVAGALRPVPTSPPALLRTNLIGVGAKLRLLGEPFVSRRQAEDEETVLAFSARRFGREAAERVVAPAVIGIYAGDAGSLSVAAAFPRIGAMEREHGSVIRGLFRGRGGARMGRPVSFPEGLGELPAALARALGDRRFVARATAIEPRPAGGWRIATAEGPSHEAERLVLATPGAVTAALLAPLVPEAAAALRAIPHAPVAIACLGFRSADDLGVDLDAYGFVVARGEGVRLLGCQYESSVFPDRAPSGGVLLRALLGGSFEPSLVDEDDATLAGTAVADLRRTAGLRRDPDFVDVWRARPGIPQYDRGHLARVHAVDAAIAALPGLRVIGHALRGVGVSACIAAAGECARAIAFPR